MTCSKKNFVNSPITGMRCTAATCTMESTGASTDPLTVYGTIAAGCVCEANEGYDESCMLAQIYFPVQEYRAGFTPENALCNGTMFPELVRLYK